MTCLQLMGRRHQASTSGSSARMARTASAGGGSPLPRILMAPLFPINPERLGGA